MPQSPQSRPDPDTATRLVRLEEAMGFADHTVGQLSGEVAELSRRIAEMQARIQRLEARFQKLLDAAEPEGDGDPES